MAEIVTVISALSALVAIFYAVKNGRRSNEDEIAEKIARETRIDMKLDEISNNVKEVKETVKSIQNDVKDHEGRIVKLEASYKSEHKRLDNLFELVTSKEVKEDE